MSRIKNSIDEIKFSFFILYQWGLGLGEVNNFLIEKSDWKKINKSQF